MNDEVRQLRVEVQVLERAVHRFEERLAGLREEVTKGFDRTDIVLANQFGEVLMLLNQTNARIDELEKQFSDRLDGMSRQLDEIAVRTEERHTELINAIKDIRP